MKQNAGGFLIFAFISYVIFQSIQEFQKIAWGSGIWWGEYSLKWGMLYAVYILFCIGIVIFTGFVLWRPARVRSVFEKIIILREQSGALRGLFALLIFISPVWFFQYTPWGIVFSGMYIRLVFWCLVVFCDAFFITKGTDLFSWTTFLIVLFLTSSEFVVAVPFMNVTDHPFSLGWSEGNRMWDYSILFGRHLYDYPADQPISVLLDSGRQFVGGLPFIISGLTIKMERFWIALTVIIPYLLLGLAAFRFVRRDVKMWLLMALWVLIFLKQGPIHPPLVLCAVAVALLWRSPLWLALPLIAVTGYIAEGSRFTWVFAPGMWLGMLEMAGAALQGNKLSHNAWIRAISLGLVGMAGGQFGRKIAGLLAGNTTVSAATSVSGVTAMVSTPTQPLLWYRLLPNETYGVGILAGLLIAILPLIIVLLYLIGSKKWVLNVWQVLAVMAPLLAFLGVGLIVSTKIGGGGDLHNMDMFLIGIIFVSVVAWQKSGEAWLTNIDPAPIWIKLIIILLIGLPGFQNLGQMRSFRSVENIGPFLTLTDTPDGKFLDMYPSQAVTDSALNIIRDEVLLAQAQGGKVLFMDQRQLLTFGYIKNVPLIPEYEKKKLMNEALSSNAAYFENFYKDIAAHRFALIISEPLRAPIKDSSFQFGEENNAWVKWVSNPVLCYYEEKISFKEMGVQLLVPKTIPLDCADQLLYEN